MIVGPDLVISVERKDIDQMMLEDFTPARAGTHSPLLNDGIIYGLWIEAVDWLSIVSNRCAWM